jgi:high-affinity iron transporter
VSCINRKDLEPMPILSVAVQSGSILLREGLEALLIISALAAFLQRAGAQERVRTLYWGGALAILASFAAALVFETFYGGVHDDRIEAGVMLLAAALMFYMSGWLFVRQDPRRWQGELRQAADKAVQAGTTLSLGLIAFMAVFREGGETVLFLHALAKSSGGWSLGFFLGLVAATFALAVLFVLIRFFAMRLPLRPLFVVTSAFLFLMALKFVGGALKEFQEMQLVSFTPIDLPGWLVDLGLNPTVEALFAQGAIAVAAICGTAVAYMKAKAAEPMGQVAS